MSKRKSTYKGVRYIAQSLTKYFGKQYPNYKSALPKARELKDQLDKEGKNVRLQNIFPLVRKGGAGKKGAPELDPELARMSYYFELQRYPSLIARVSNEIWFKSKITPSDSGDIQGGSYPDYSEYFSPYVGYINALAAQYDREESRYSNDWLVMCTPPVYNRYKKRWESEIISVDGEGTPIDYGFNPKKPSQTAPEAPEVPTPQARAESAPTRPETPKTTTPEKDVKVIQAETDKIKAETEQKRQENISNLLKMFGEGQLTKAEFKELMNKIK
jgi:hypothetical protein